MVETIRSPGSLGQAGAGQSTFRRILRSGVHFFSYHLVLKRNRTVTSRAAGFSLRVPPTVFHPRFFRASEVFAGFIGRLDLTGRHIADVGTGSGILALAAARAGAASVLALDINPNAVASAAANARINGHGRTVSAVCSDLFSAVAPRPMFDLILSNPPYFPGRPRDLADRAWHAGQNYRDILPIFEQARERLRPGGQFYVLLSSDSDLDYLHDLMDRARFRRAIAARYSIVIETLLIYELTAK